MQNISIDEIEKTSVPVYNNQKVSSFNEKNYLNVKLAKGENERKITIRLITIDKNSSSPWMRIHMHGMKVPQEVSENGFKAYVCLNKTRNESTEPFGHFCPFCEERNAAYNKYKENFDAGNIEEANKWKSKSLSMIPQEVGIIRCIERGKEDEGVKFWKFNIRTDKKDPENQIKTLYNNVKEECEEEGRPIENILDLETGRDLRLTITRIFDRDGNPTDKSTVTISTFGNPKPLTTDPELRSKWLNDPKIWSDVFTVKPYDYLSLILNNKIPYFDKNNGKWIEKMSKEEYLKKLREERDSDSEKKDAEARKIDEQIAKVTPVDVVQVEVNPIITKVTPPDSDDDGLPF